MIGGPFMRPIYLYSIRISAAITGRLLRKWWQRQTPERKKFITKHVFHNRWKYIASSSLLGYAGYESYRNKVFITPYTNRERFMPNSRELLLNDTAEFYKEFYLSNRENILPNNHPYVISVIKTVQRIIKCNKDIPKLLNMYWSVIVIDSPIRNCCALETGNILIYKGMIDATDNVDQLAAILAHEMSHVLLDHVTEKYNNTLLREKLFFLPILLLWALLPTDFLGYMSSIFFSKSVRYIFELPYSRTIEEEADVVGLFLMASACFDVRESSAFWGKEDINITTKGEKKWYTHIDWFSTHPSHQNRQALLNNFMDDAMKIRNLKRCPMLKKSDPRILVKLAQEYLPESMQKTQLDQISLKNDFSKFDDTAKIFLNLKSK